MQIIKYCNGIFFKDDATLTSSGALQIDFGSL